jgi:hypothetical protein
VLYVAARLSTLVDFEELLEPAALLTPELRERVGVVSVGPRSLVLVPLRDLAEGERLLVPVTGRTEAGEPRTLTLALVTRRDEVDLQARVSFASRELRPAEDEDETVGAVAGMLLASHGPGAQPRLALVTPGERETLTQAGNAQGWIESVLQMDRRRLFVTVAVKTLSLSSKPWRLVRVRVEAGCWGARGEADVPLPVLIRSAVAEAPVQRHTMSTWLPDEARCLSLTLEEDGARTLRFERVRLWP